MKQTTLRKLAQSAATLGALMLLSAGVLIGVELLAAARVLTRLGVLLFVAGVYVTRCKGRPAMYFIRPLTNRTPGPESDAEADRLCRALEAEQWDERGRQVQAKAGQTAFWVVFGCLVLGFEVFGLMADLQIWLPGSVLVRSVCFLLGLVALGAYFLAGHLWNKRM